MDIQQLVGAITASTNPDPTIRKAGEDALKQQHLVLGGLVTLLRVAVEESMEPSVRQVAAITFKNAVKRDWELKESRPCLISEEEKAAVRPLVIEGVIASPHHVRVQLEEALKTIIATDYPERWPDIIPAIAASLNSGDQALISGALRTLRIVVRKYEFRDESERAPLIAAVEGSFPSVLAVFQTLLANTSTSPDLAELFKLCCKIFWSSCYLEIPALLMREDQFAGWMSALLSLAGRPVPTEGAPEDLELRKQWPWWKAKKWVYHVSYRLFTRYGEPKKSREGGVDVAFATRWKGECSMLFLLAVLQELSAVANGCWVAPRVSNILLQYVAEAVREAHSWKTLKPHVQNIVEHAVMPLLSFDEEDAELWQDDPQDYIRKGYDVIEDIYSSKTAAMGVIDALCSSKKTQLDPVMAHIVGIMNEALANNVPGDPSATAAARKLDGALLAVGTLHETLKKKARYKTQLEPMLQQHVVPLFASPHGHLRAKACWLAGLYADAPLGEGLIGTGATFSAMLQCVITALNDPELPVRVDAGVAVRSFVEAIEADDLGPLRPLVPELLQRFLAISHEIDSEDLTNSLETVMERFGSDMGPYAVAVVSSLTQQFWRAVAEDEGGGGGTADGGGTEEDGSGGALAGYSMLGAISTVLDAVSSLPELYPQLEELLFPIMEKYTSEDGLDVFEEITQLITYLTYYTPAITPRMWSLYPRLIACVDSWAVDYWRDVLLPLDNFISRGAEVFLTGSAPPVPGAPPLSLLDMTNRLLEKTMAPPPPSAPTTAAGACSDGESIGSLSLNEALICAAQLISVILQNCKGRVDHCVAPYLALITRQLPAAQAQTDDGEYEDREVYDSLLLAGADALFYNPALTLNALASSGTLSLFMGSLAKSIGEKRKTGLMRHFTRKSEKKVVALGLSAVLGVPLAQLPPGVGNTLGQVTAAVLQLLQALKRQEQATAGTVEIRSEDSSGSDGLRRFGGGGSGNESDNESDDDGEDEDLSPEELVRRAMAAQRRAGFDDVDDDDWDSGEDWSEDDEEDGADVFSPLDKLSPYVFFAETLQGVQMGDAAAFRAITGGMDGATQAAVQEMMTYANEVKTAEMNAAVANGGGVQQ